MLSIHNRLRSTHREFSSLLIGGIVLFGCGRESHDEDNCGTAGQCAARGGAQSSGGSGGNSGTHSTGGAKAGGGMAGGTGSGASGGVASHAGGASATAGAAGNSGHSGTSATSGGSGGVTANGGTGGTGAIGGLPNDAGAGGVDDRPKICPDGSFDHDGDPTTTCKGWSRCPPGQFIAKEGTDTRDRQCAICGDGTYSTTQNVRMCTPWTDCAPNTYVTHAGSTTSNQTCSACPTTGSKCLPAGACLFSGGCQPGTVQVTAASGTTPATCTACGPGDYCAGGLTPQVRCDSGTWDDDGNAATCCSPWATCAAGTYVSKAGTAATNRECTSCAAGNFAQYSNADRCSPWTVCPAASSAWPQGGTTTTGTATSDAVCTDPYYKFNMDASTGGNAIAVDSSGNVYVAGYTSGALAGANAGGADAFVRKLDPHGTVLWTRQFGTASDDQATGVAVDASGNVYVGGTTHGALQGANGGQEDAFVRKLDPSGATLWTSQLATWRSDSAYALAIDGKGNSFIAGTSYGNGQNTGEAFVTKIDATGTIAWTQLFGGPDEDGAMAVAVDATGNVYVGGYCSYGFVANSDKGQRDAILRKFDPSGATLWSRQFGSTENDFIYGARVDSSGNLYVSGSTAGLAGTQSEGALDAFVRKFDGGGSTLWTHQAATPGLYYAYALAMDGQNNVYMVGSTSDNDSNVFVRKLNSSGTAQWTKQMGTTRNDTALGAAADANGDVYVTGYTSEPFGSTSDTFVWYVPAE